MAKIVNKTKVITGPRTRWSYANVWDPKSINGGTPKYSVSLIIPKSDKKTVEAIKAAIQAAYEEGESKLTLTCQLRKPAHEFGHWYALVVDKDGNKLEDGYLGVVGGEGNPANDGADHYSVGGYLKYARRD